MSSFSLFCPDPLFSNAAATDRHCGGVRRSLSWLRALAKISYSFTGMTAMPHPGLEPWLDGKTLTSLLNLSVNLTHLVFWKNL